MATTEPDCLTCGACCAYSSSWPVFIGDGDAAGIPDRLVDSEGDRMLCHGNRCAALEGELGRRVRCTIYSERPLVCREFQAGTDDCMMARAARGIIDT